MAGAEAPWTAEPDGVTLWLRLTPKGGRDAIDGVETLADGRAVLKARVRAAPEDGRANAALIELIAKALAAPKRAVTIRSGETSRLKKIFIAGDPAPIIDALARLAPTKD
ncbi:hypothetical protein AMST5_01515 [freshwater sediment metagenome]|uniref:Uncharacterized protein n=1 Tax=freshwater sediment metagenome TaxID=556182 RepID=A0AA48LYI8_9ZZZZ